MASVSTLLLPGTSTTHLPPSPPSVNKKSRKFAKHSKGTATTPTTSLTAPEPELTLDLNVDDMNGIVDFNPSRNMPPPSSAVGPWDDPPPPGTMIPRPLGVTIPSYNYGGSFITNPDPFSLKTPTGNGRTPASLTPEFSAPYRTLPSAPALSPTPTQADWTAPESWAVDRDHPDYSSSDESLDAGRNNSKAEARGSRRASTLVSQNGTSRQFSVSKGKERDNALEDMRSKQGSFTGSLSPGSANSVPYNIRIYRADGTYHVVSCPLDTKVVDMQNVLSKKLLLTRETHRLYLRERGRGLSLSLSSRNIHADLGCLQNVPLDLKRDQL